MTPSSSSSTQLTPKSVKTKTPAKPSLLDLIKTTAPGGAPAMPCVAEEAATPTVVKAARPSPAPTRPPPSRPTIVKANNQKAPFVPASKQLAGLLSQYSLNENAPADSPSASLATPHLPTPAAPKSASSATSLRGWFASGGSDSNASNHASASGKVTKIATGEAPAGEGRGGTVEAAQVENQKRVVIFFI